MEKVTTFTPLTAFESQYSQILTFLLQTPKRKVSFLMFFISQMKNIKSHDLEATPMGGSTSNSTSDVVCLLLLA